MTTTLRRLRGNEWEAYRVLRLDALADSPDAFGSTHERESVRPDEEWRQRVEAGVASESDLPLVAESEGVLVALAWGRLRPEERSTAELFQMWVHPSHRGIGLGRAMVDEVVGWARTAGAERLTLAVTSGNGPAEELYRKAGFASDGPLEPLRHGSSLMSQRMVLHLRRNGGPAAKELRL